MSRGGAIPYFGDAYMADTRHLTLEEHGAYHLLILIAWRSPNCALPDDDRRLAQMLGCTAKKWASLKPTIMAFWTLTENGWEQKRLTKERRWVEEKSRKSAAAAEAKWEAKRLENNDMGDADASANAQPDAHANGYAPPPPPPPPEPIGSKKASTNVDVSDCSDPPLTRAEVLDAWQNQLVPLGFPRIAKMNASREKQLRARLKDSTLEEWQRAMDALARSRFCQGENDRGWVADFDFLLQPKSFTKLLEGAYDH